MLAALAPFLPDLIATVGGLVVSPVYDFFKKKFIKGEADTPSKTMGSLAVTKPEALGPYIEGLVRIKEMDIRYYNRDVVGTLSVWVSDLRAAIRPITVIASLACLFLDGFGWLDLGTGARVTFEACVTSWMGDRFTLGDKK